MFQWMVPSFYGDLRLEALEKKRCKLIVEQATMAELAALMSLQATAASKGWCGPGTVLKEGVTTLAAPIEKVARVLAKVLKPGKETVSAVRISGGKIEEIRHSDFAVPATSAETKDANPSSPTTDKKEEAEEKAPEIEEKKVATTVAKPTRGCPPPDFPSAELKATRVLEAFLTPEQREDFHRHNQFITVGGATGHRYMVTSRHNRAGLEIYSRSLYDLDLDLSICTHDHDVPAPEELLALHILVTLPGHELALAGLAE